MTPQLSLNLANLRLWLADAQYQALRIGTGDEFLNKYAPAYTKRIGWLTGFEGSAGDLLITAHAATLVTDRRYTDIALEILDPSLFTVTDHAATSPEEWLIQNLAPGDRVACHGWVYSMRQMNRMEAALAKAGIALTLLDENPVDALWPTQPPRDIVPAWPHDITYAGKTSTDKRLDIAQTLGQHERLLLTSGESIAWLLNMRCQDLPLHPSPQAWGMLEPTGDFFLLIDPLKIPPSLQDTWDNQVHVINLKDWPSFLASQSEGRTVLYDPSATPAPLGRALSTFQTTLKEGPDPCLQKRAIKNTVELEQMRLSHIYDAVALVQFFWWLKTEARAMGALSEWDAALYLESLKQANPHYGGQSFETIASSGAHTALIHYSPSATRSGPLQRDALFLCDAGTQYRNGCTTDVTRTLILGTATAEQCRYYTAVLKGFIALSRVTFPPHTRGVHLDALARLALWEQGADYPHATGHGVGSFLSVHEGPHGISRRDDGTPLEAGMIVTNEPGYYRTGHFGIRIENMMEVIHASLPSEEDGQPFLAFAPLTLVPFEPALIQIAALTDLEKMWINTYHARVYHTLAPYLTDPVRTWLKAQTNPL